MDFLPVKSQNIDFLLVKSQNVDFLTIKRQNTCFHNKVYGFVCNKNYLEKRTFTTSLTYKQHHKHSLEKSLLPIERLLTTVLPTAQKLPGQRPY